jgi:hypothetical protein
MAGRYWDIDDYRGRIPDDGLSMVTPEQSESAMEKERSKQRCKAAGYFVISTTSMFAAITYAAIYIQVAEFSIMGSTVIPLFWFLVSIGNMWNASEKFYRLDVDICEDYYEKALEEAKKKLRVVEETDMDDHCGFLMRQVGVQASATSEICDK